MVIAFIVMSLEGRVWSEWSCEDLTGVVLAKASTRVVRTLELCGLGRCGSGAVRI